MPGATLPPPNEAGLTLLEHYREERQIDALIGMGSILHLEETPEGTVSHHGDHGVSWDFCQPVEIMNGADGFFKRTYMPGPEWLYRWTPDGWLAAEAEQDLPLRFLEMCYSLSTDAFEDWFENNQDPEFVNWRWLVKDKQTPQSLLAVIERYAQKHGLENARWSVRFTYCCVGRRHCQAETGMSVTAWPARSGTTPD